MRRLDRATPEGPARRARMALRMGLMLCISSAWVAGPALAEKDYHDSGVYVVGGLMPVIPTLQNLEPVDFKAALGGQLAVGYRAFSPLAVQLRGGWLGTGFNKEPHDAAGTNVNAATVTAEAKLFFLSKRFQPFALLGVGGMWAKLDVPDVSPETTKEWSSVVRVGGGFDFWASENVFIGFGAYYVAAQQDNSDVRYVEVEFLQIGYRF
jgi:opacity protein-like surface antigen